MLLRKRCGYISSQLGNDIARDKIGEASKSLESVAVTSLEINSVCRCIDWVC